MPELVIGKIPLEERTGQQHIVYFVDENNAPRFIPIIIEEEED